MCAERILYEFKQVSDAAENCMVESLGLPS